MRSLKEIFAFTRGETIAVALLLAVCLIGGGIRLIQYADKGVPPALILRSLDSSRKTDKRSKTIESSQIAPESQREDSKSTRNVDTPPTESTARHLLININSASADSLALLPFVGPALSKRIVEYRDKHGPYQSVDQLVAVYGIGPKNLEKIRPFIVCQ